MSAEHILLSECCGWPILTEEQTLSGDICSKCHEHCGALRNDVAADTAYANWLAEGRRRGWLTKADALAAALDNMTKGMDAVWDSRPFVLAKQVKAGRAALAAYRDEEKP